MCVAQPSPIGARNVTLRYVNRSSSTTTEIYGVSFTLWTLTMTYELRNVTHATRARSVDHISGHIFRLIWLWTKVHEINDCSLQRHFRWTISLLTSFRIYMRLSCDAVRNLAQILLFFWAANFFWSANPNFRPNFINSGRHRTRVKIWRRRRLGAENKK